METKNIIQKSIILNVINNYKKNTGRLLYNISELPTNILFDKKKDSLIYITINNYPRLDIKKINELKNIFSGSLNKIRYYTVNKLEYDNHKNNKISFEIKKDIIYCIEKRTIINKTLMKRKRTDTNNYINIKKNCSNNFRNNKRLRNKYISPTALWNFFHDDTIIDWLKICNITSMNDIIEKNYEIKKRKKKNININLEFKLNAGLLFEHDIINWLHNKGFDIININTNKYNCGCYENKKNTIDAIKNGREIIYQGYLSNNENKTHGIPDLLIRSDIINKIFNYQIIEKPFNKSSNLKNKFYYVVVDIKNTALHLNSDGETLRNTKSMKFYKIQLLIYNLALGKIQNYLSDKAYILGKRWFYQKKKEKYNGEWNTKLGEIHYTNKDIHCLDSLNLGIEWLQDVKKNGNKWSFDYQNINNYKYLKPTRLELYPNMKNSYDNFYHNIKKEIAQEIGEITQIAYCGIKHRNNAHDNEIYTYFDKDCTAKIMGFKNNLKTIVDNILIVNKPNGPTILPKGEIKNNINNWKYTKDCEYYIDFETIGSSVNKSSIHNDFKLNDFIFMIGIYHKKHGYKSFITKSLTLQEEKRVVNEFWKYINTITKNKPSRFYHWTHHEPNVYKKVNKRHGNIWQSINFVDLYEIFKKEPIVIKGALNFKLKSVAKAIHNIGHIPTIWEEDNPCANGMDAMILAYLEYNKKNKISSSNKIMKDIIKYNEKDCDVLYHILKFIRQKK